MAKFSISLVYTRNKQNSIETALRVLVTNAENSDEALGKGINNFSEEMENYSLTNKVVVEIILDTN